MNRRELLRWSALVGVEASSTWPALAQIGAAKPLRLIVPFGTGGPVDVVTRSMTEKLQADLNRPVVVENKPGAGGLLAAQYVAQQPADGSAIFVATLGTISSPLLQAKPIIDPVADLIPIARVVMTPVLLVINAKKWPALRTFADFIQYAKAHPDQINAGMASLGGQDHLLVEMLNQKVGTHIQPVAYKGSAAVMLDLIAGRVDLQVSSYSPFKPYIDSGVLRVLASVGARSPFVPDVPGSADVGLPDWDLPGWTGWMTTLGTPAQLVEPISAAVARALELPDVRATAASVGMVPSYANAADFGAALRADSGKLARVIREAHVKLE